MSELHTVVKAFNTPTRRFAVGAEIQPDDIDGGVTFERLRFLGHIETVTVNDEPDPVPAELPPADRAPAPSDGDPDAADHEAADHL